MGNLLRPILTTVAEFAKEKFVKKTRHTAQVQEQFLRQLLRRQQSTALGRQYQLREIQTIDQFRDRIPILSYSSYEPYIEQIANGEQNVLVPERVIYLNTTSGSSGKSKLIPITQRFQNSLGWANLTSIGFLSQGLRSRGLRFGKLLVTNTVQRTGRTSAGIDYGPGGTGVLRTRRWIYEQLFAHPYETLEPKDSITRHYLCFLFALGDPQMGGIAANFPMLILRICNYLERFAEDLIQDIETGKLAAWLQLSPQLRATLEQRWTADPKRAAQLREILRSQGRLTPKLAWPNLSYIATARGGTSDFYFQRFPRYLDDTPVFGAVYASAEATYSIYPDLNTDGSVLAVETGFFEFIPQDQWDKDHPQTLLATEVKPGQYYRILSTNDSGFYRYDNGDVVEVVGFYESAPLIVFRHRRGGLLSSTTEKTTEAHATQVMQALQREFSNPIDDFCITLSEHEFPAHYIVNVELNPESSLDNPQAFLRRFDEKLKEVNVYYASKRKDQVPPPRLHILAPGSFQVIHQRQLAKGIPDSQLKFPHISEDRTLVAGLEVLQAVKLPEDRDELMSPIPGER